MANARWLGWLLAGGAMLCAGPVGISRAADGARPLELVAGRSDGKVQEQGGRWAVIVGNNDYSHTGMADLRFSERDAEAIRDELVQHGGFSPAHVQLLLGKDATLPNIIDRLAYLRDLPASQNLDLALFYFSGHGGVFDTRSDSPNAPGQSESYLVPYDGINRVDYADSRNIPLAKVRSILEQSHFPRKVLMLDACRNIERLADAKGSASIGGFNARAYQAAEGMQILAATRQGELSYEDETLDGGHGVFTYFVLQGLRGAPGAVDASGAVTFNRLEEFVGDQMSDYGFQHTDRKQKPMVTGEGLGGIWLTLAPTLANGSGSGPKRNSLWGRGAIRQLTMGSGSVAGAAASPDGGFVAASQAGGATIWQVPSGRAFGTYEMPLCSRVALSRGAGFIAATGKGALKCWRVSPKTVMIQSENVDWEFELLDLSDDGAYLAVAATNHEDRRHEIQVWSTATGRQLSTLTLADSMVDAIEFSPDGELLAAGCDKGIRLWHRSSGLYSEERSDLIATRYEPSWLAFSPNGKMLAAATGLGFTKQAPNDAVTLYDVGTRNMLGFFGSADLAALWGLRFSSDSQRLEVLAITSAQVKAQGFGGTLLELDLVGLPSEGGAIKSVARLDYGGDCSSTVVVDDYILTPASTGGLELLKAAK